jgi:DNA-binding MarR family transcriptional regulator
MKPRAIDLLARARKRLDATYCSQHPTPELTLPQVAILQALKSYGRHSQRDLVRLTGIDRSTMSEMLRRMSQRSLVTESRSALDKRVLLCAITGAGYQALHRCESAIRKTEADVIKLMPKSYRAQFLAGLRAIVATQ